MKCVRLEKRVPAKNQLRFYCLDLQPTLFGEWSIVREWGRIGHGGRMLLTTFPSYAEAASAFAGKVAEKRRRGYLPTPATLPTHS